METLDDFKKLIRTTTMTRIYKQVMLQAVLKRGGSATKDEIAGDILASDVFQREHYRKKIVDAMPGNRLVRDGALIRDNGSYRLAIPFENMTEPDRQELIDECQLQIDEHIEKFGDTFRPRTNDPVSGSVAYEVKKRAGGRCELCGASHSETQLDVDHVVPRNKGGSNELANLQMLCRTCNAQKRDNDDTDFRAITESYGFRDADCIFCQKECGDDELAFVVEDEYPVTEGHALVMPRRHVSDYFALHQPERNAIERILHNRQKELLSRDPSISGFNVGVNSGPSAGQTILHVHIHLIPRRDGDMDDPRGGVRGVIPEMQKYSVT
ncbi:MAG: HIT domain-containing protein [Rhodospirillaceae bacterium]|jgi:ATP adenylyltransferase|nr:HIT domain-containing protein [Rhodospirillaceae bacterium]